MKLSKEFIAMLREEAKKAQWEINCWNGKSIDDLVVDYLERKELKPEDFTGAVVLTVEEAEKLMKLLDLCEYWLTNNNVSYDCDAWASLLEERIEQSEKQK